jgi:hypothetical protein
VTPFLLAALGGLTVAVTVQRQRVLRRRLARLERRFNRYAVPRARVSPLLRHPVALDRPDGRHVHLVSPDLRTGG